MDYRSRRSERLHLSVHEGDPLFEYHLERDRPAGLRVSDAAILRRRYGDSPRTGLRTPKWVLRTRLRVIRGLANLSSERLSPPHSRSVGDNQREERAGEGGRARTPEPAIEQ